MTMRSLAVPGQEASSVPRFCYQILSLVVYIPILDLPVDFTLHNIIDNSQYNTQYSHNSGTVKTLNYSSMYYRDYLDFL
jgi:hypothetical protein